MNFSVWKMFSRASMSEIGLRMVAQTLPALPVWQGWPVRKELASVEGFSGMSTEDVVQLRGCFEESTGAGEFVGTEDWGYIRPVADGESPFGDWVTSLQTSHGTCTWLVAAAPAFQTSVGDNTW